MMRTILTATALAALLLGTALSGAQAQVATTDLVPAAPRFIHPNATGTNSANITPDNPAALAWGKPSRVAAGVMKGEHANDGDPANSPYDNEGQFAGVRFVGEMFGFAAEMQNVDTDVAGTTIVDENQDVQLSLALGGWLAFGIGVGSNSNDGSGSQADTDRVQAGASVRLGEIFYLGAGIYQDEQEVVGSTGYTFERNGTLYGAAVRTDGPWNWYLAYDVVDLDEFDYSRLGGGATDGGGFKLSTATVQLNANAFLIGLSSGDLEVKSGGPGEVAHQAVDIGYAPMEGLTVSARLQRTEVTDSAAPGNDEEVEATSLAVSWQF